MRALTIMIIGILVFASSVCLVSADDTYYGMDIYGGTATDMLAMDNTKGELVMVNILMGKYFSDNFSAGIELGLGQYTIKTDTTVTPFTAQFKINAMYDVLQIWDWNVYGEGGVGLGYLGTTKSHDVVAHNNVPGIFQFGLGIRNDNYIIGARIAHISSIFERCESGFDTIGLHVAYLF